MSNIENEKVVKLILTKTQIMRFPSLIRLPRNKQYYIKPRYYDPIKEEIEERTSRIKREMEGDSEEDYGAGRISFQRKRDALPSASFMQLIIATLLGTSVVGWLYFGNDIVYALFLIIPIYAFIRFRKLRGK